MNTSKECVKCHTLKPLIDFYNCAASKTRKNSYCKVCSWSYFTEWRRKNPRWKPRKENERKYALKKKYGLTPEDVLRMKDDQCNSCKICLIDFDSPLNKVYYPGGVRFNVDHCHKTNKVRGLLCGYCNSMLGYAKDAIGTLNNAILYLKRSYEAQ